MNNEREPTCAESLLEIAETLFNLPAKEMRERYESRSDREKDHISLAFHLRKQSEEFKQRAIREKWETQRILDEIRKINISKG